MFPSKLRSLIDTYCRGKQPTAEQKSEIMKLASSLSVDSQDVDEYIEIMRNYPTREQLIAIAEEEYQAIQERAKRMAKSNM
jgi:hypothetical protein